MVKEVEEELSQPLCEDEPTQQKLSAKTATRFNLWACVLAVIIVASTIVIFKSSQGCTSTNPNNELGMF